MTRTLVSWIDGKLVEPRATDAAFDLVSPIDGKLLCLFHLLLCQLH